MRTTVGYARCYTSAGLSRAWSRPSRAVRRPRATTHDQGGSYTERLFGTDGVRGIANLEFTPELALSLSVSAGYVVARTFNGARPLAVVGRDTRVSGEFLGAAVVAGLASAGVDVMLLGVIPTPGVAYITQAIGADLGVSLSASHNAMADNGIKSFNRVGMKLSDEIEDAIELRMTQPWARPTGAAIGRVREATGPVDRYVEHLVGVPPRQLDGINVVVDCSNGTASYIAPNVLRRAGATVTATAVEPDGVNINDRVGATYVENLAKLVVERGAHIGIALDGDADRCIAVDAEGRIVGGDAILAICALAMRDGGRLHGDAVVTTVSANLGLLRAMAIHKIAVTQVDVGDRYVS